MHKSLEKCGPQIVRVEFLRFYFWSLFDLSFQNIPFENRFSPHFLLLALSMFILVFGSVFCVLFYVYDYHIAISLFIVCLHAFAESVSVKR